MITEITTEEVFEVLTDFLYPEENEIYTVPIDLLPEKLNDSSISTNNISLYDVSFSYERNAVLNRQELKAELKRIISNLPQKAKEQIKNDAEIYIIACFLQKDNSE